MRAVGVARPVLDAVGGAVESDALGRGVERCGAFESRRFRQFSIKQKLCLFSDLSQAHVAKRGSAVSGSRSQRPNY
jgi:hypothetical protein